MPWFVRRSSKSKRTNCSRRSPRLVGYRLLVTPSDRRAEPVSVFRPDISAPYTGRQQSISHIPHVRHFHPDSGAQVGTTSAFTRTTQHPQQTGDSPSSSKWPAQCSEQNQVQYRRPLGSLDNFPRVLPSTSLCLESQPQVVFAESQHKSTASSGTGVDRLEFGRGCSRPAELLTTLTAAPASPAAVLPVHRHLPLPPSASNSNSTSSSSDPSTSTSAPTASVSAASLSANTSSASPFRRGMTVASYGMVLCGNSDDVHHRYRGKLEKVKFGVPISEAFAHDIPATLLVLLLKVNKEGPYKKDIWRAPGNQQQVRKLAQIMQHGRLVNIANFSVYTAASVIKKFLSKLPGGIFGHENEQSLFNNAVNNSDIEKQRQVFYRVFCSLPVPSQHLLVLLFGTFRTVADSADAMGTTMTPNAIAISVAPSLFHSCIHDGRAARVEDLQRFKLASQIVCSIITSFGDTNLFPRESYEFYARITGRQLRVDENWTFSFTYPSRYFSCQPEVDVAVTTEFVSEGDENKPGPSKRHSEPIAGRLTSRLSSSVGEVLHETSDMEEHTNAEAMRPVTACAGERSVSYLDWVYENQKQRMKSRSEWFLQPLLPTRPGSKSIDFSHYALPSTKHVPTHFVKTLDGRTFSRDISPMQIGSPLIEESPTASTPGDKKESSESPGEGTSSEQRQPLAERQNSKKGQIHRLPLQQRLSGTQQQQSGPLNIAGFVVPSSTTTSKESSTSSTASVTRRRSWRTHYVRPQLEETASKTHSLDLPESPRSSQQRLGKQTHSVGEDLWMTSEEIPKKRRSLKKKPSKM